MCCAQTIKVSNSIDEKLIGGNTTSALGGEGERSEVPEDVSVVDTVETAINIVFAHKLQKFPMTKPDFVAWVKQYMKKYTALLTRSLLSVPF